MPMVQSLYFTVRFSGGDSIHCGVLLRPQRLPRATTDVGDMDTAILNGEENTVGIAAFSVKKLADFFVKGVILEDKQTAAWHGAQGFHRIDQPIIPGHRGLWSLGGDPCIGRVHVIQHGLLDENLIGFRHTELGILCFFRNRSGTVSAS